MDVRGLLRILSQMALTLILLLRSIPSTVWFHLSQLFSSTRRLASDSAACIQEWYNLWCRFIKQQTFWKLDRDTCFVFHEKSQTGLADWRRWRLICHCLRLNSTTSCYRLLPVNKHSASAKGKTKDAAVSVLIVIRFWSIIRNWLSPKYICPKW